MRTFKSKRWQIILAIMILCLLVPVAANAATYSNPLSSKLTGSQVSPYTGGFSYSYPIEVPAGPGNITPQISLNYSSTSMNQGTGDQTSPRVRMGRGWSLTGLISVEKNGGNYYLVENGAANKLYLGSDGRYHTESESFAAIHKAQYGDFEYWWLKTKDGTYHRMGFDENARHWNVADYSWEEDYAEDTYGNTRSVSYGEYDIPDVELGMARVDLISFPSRISYNNITIDFQVDNYWNYDSTTETKYSNSSKILGITVKANGALVNRYALGYLYSGLDAFSLGSIVKYGNDNVTAEPATTFTYDSNYALMTSFNNGVGGTKTIEYVEFWNTGTRHKVYREISYDGMGRSVTLNYNFPGDGLYQDGEFRGFSNSTVTDAANTVTQTWFNQDSIKKGLPSTVQIRNSSGNTMKTTNYTYTSINTATGSAGGYTGAKKLAAVAGDGAAFAATSPDGYGLKWTGSIWDASLGGQVKSISAKNTNELWATSSDNTTWQWTSAGGWVYKAGGSMKRVAISSSDGALYAIDFSENIYKWNGSGWVGFGGGGALRDISVRNDGEIWGIGGTDELWCWTSGSGWSYKGAPAGKTLLKVAVSSSDGAVYCIDSNNEMVRYNGSWDYSKGGALKEVSVKDAGEIWGIGMNDQVWRYYGGWSQVDAIASGGAYFTGLSQQDDYIYDGDATYTQIQVKYEYDDFGNITKTSNMGNAASSGDEVYTYTEYLYNDGFWLKGVPKRTYVKNSAGTTVAESWNYYSDTYNGTVNYDSATKFLRKTENALALGSRGNTLNPTNEFTYDQWSNVLTVKDANGNITSTSYDSTYHVFPLSVTNAKGQTVSNWYYGVNAFGWGSGVFGQIQCTQDINAHNTCHKYDPRGRLTASWREGFAEGSPEISYQYQDWVNNNSLNCVITRKRISPGGGTIDTFTYTDGLGRILQKQVPSEIDGVMLVSGMASYEGRGLVSASYVQKKVQSTGAFLPSPPLEKPTYYYYDALGRNVQTTYPDSTSTGTYYHELLQVDTDQSNKQVYTYFDAYGRVITKENPGGGPITMFSYDALGRRLSTWDRSSNTNTATYDALGRQLTSSDVDMGSWSYSYDKNGNLTSQTDGKGKTTTMTYDALNRLLTKVCTDSLTPANTVNVAYTYDTGSNGLGRLYREVNISNEETVTTVYSYNAWGDVTQTTRTVGGTNYSISTAYDMMERPASVTYPDGTGVYYTYNDNDGSLALVGSTPGGSQYLQGITYDNYGLVTCKALGNGLGYSYSYNYNSFWVEHNWANGPGGPVMSFWYNHDGNRNILNIADDVNNYNWGYSYDSSNRLTRAYRGNGVNPSSDIYDKYYTYDNNNGNIATFEGKTYSYGDTSHKHAVTSDGTNTFAYDANGNMTSGGGRTITWSMANMPMSVTKGGVTTKFVYDGSGSKVKQIVGSAWRVYIGGIYEKDSTGAGECLINLGGVTVKKKSDGSVFYILGDHLGSSSVIVNSAGVLSTRQYYQPFGADDATGTSVGEVDYHKYTGQEQIGNTGLYYYGGRYYDAALGRFISADPFLGMNRYAYCGNNPINNTDPSGYDIFGIGAWINDQSSFDKCQARSDGINKAMGQVITPIKEASSASACEARYTALDEGIDDSIWQANSILGNAVSDNVFGDENMIHSVMPVPIGPGSGIGAGAAVRGFVTKHLDRLDAAATTTIGAGATYRDTGDIGRSIGVGAAGGASCYLRSKPKNWAFKNGPDWYKRSFWVRGLIDTEYDALTKLGRDVLLFPQKDPWMLFWTHQETAVAQFAGVNLLRHTNPEWEGKTGVNFATAWSLGPNNVNWGSALLTGKSAISRLSDAVRAGTWYNASPYNVSPYNASPYNASPYNVSPNIYNTSP